MSQGELIWCLMWAFAACQQFIRWLETYIEALESLQYGIKCE